MDLLASWAKGDAYVLADYVPFQEYVKAIKGGIYSDFELSEEWDLPQDKVKDVHALYESLYPSEVLELRNFSESQGV